MAMTGTSTLDCSRQNGLGITIRELEIRIAELKTYKEDYDTGAMERTLASLKTQFNRELSLS
jgi:hypothetical protein